MAKSTTIYKTCTWLNPETSRFTGSIVCYDGYTQFDGDKPERDCFVEISDCHGKVRIHKNFDRTLSEKESLREYIKKLELMRNDLTDYIDTLKIVENEKEIIQKPKLNS